MRRSQRLLLYVLIIVVAAVAFAWDSSATRCTYSEQGWWYDCDKVCDYEFGEWGCWNDWPDRCCLQYEDWDSCGEGTYDLCGCDTACGSSGF